MAESQNNTVLKQLIEISKVDIRLAVLQAQRNKITSDIAGKRQFLTTHETKCSARSKILEEKRGICSREEKSIKLERDRINERRRSLSSLNNYKVQQAAEREIDYVSKQVGQREDLLLGIMREIEIIEGELKELNNTLNGMRDELSVLDKESTEALANIDQEIGVLNSERSQLLSIVGKNPSLAVYNRIKDRHPMNPIVEVINRDSCAGCHMKLGPQVPVQISRGDVVKCPGCGRILKLAEETP